MSQPIVIAIDGPSASGKSTNAKLVATALGYVYVDTGAMYRTLAWHCRRRRVDVEDPKAVGDACARWNTSLENINGQARLTVDGYFPEKEIRTRETSADATRVAAVPSVRDWMKAKQRDCLAFGNLVMEGRDIGSNVFPETEFKFYIDASLHERSQRRYAEGVDEDLADRDQRDSQRAAAPLKVPEGAFLVNTSGQTPEESSGVIIAEIRRRLPPNSQAHSRGTAEPEANPGPRAAEELRGVARTTQCGS